MDFKQQIAKYVSGNMTTSQLPDIGIAGLNEGLDSPSLCILAGLSENENPFQIDHYFKLALKELNINLPDRRQAAIEYAIALADEIIKGKKDPIDGTREIRYKAIECYDFFSESKQYCYDSIGFEKVYGLFVTLDELSNADRPWQNDKTNEQLMQETKIELLEELKRWRDKLMNGS
jgi:hypothetical protein